jgi:PilZ domain-containing protein
MATQTGRVEKRIRLEVPMQISRLQTPGFTDLTEKTTTGNVSTHGVRVLTKRALPPQERLLVTSPISSEEPIRARVVYCQPLAEGVFGVGLQFEKGQATALREPFQPDIGGPEGAGNTDSRRAGKPFSRWSNQFVGGVCGEFLFQS